MFPKLSFELKNLLIHKKKNVLIILFLSSSLVENWGVRGSNSVPAYNMHRPYQLSQVHEHNLLIILKEYFI